MRQNTKAEKHFYIEALDSLTKVDAQHLGTLLKSLMEVKIEYGTITARQLHDIGNMLSRLADRME